jgi:hypothetical protein
MWALFGWQLVWFDAVEIDGAVWVHDDGHGVVWMRGDWPRSVSGTIDPGECTMDLGADGLLMSLVSDGSTWTGHVRVP